MRGSGVRVPLLASFQTRFVSGIRWKTCLFYFKKCLFLRHEIGTQTEAKKIMDNASKNATLEEQKRIEQAQEQIAGLVVEATAKLVAAKQNADSDRELYNQFIAKTGEEID